MQIYRLSIKRVPSVSQTNGAREGTGVLGIEGILRVAGLGGLRTRLLTNPRIRVCRPSSKALPPTLHMSFKIFASSILMEGYSHVQRSCKRTLERTGRYWWRSACYRRLHSEAVNIAASQAPRFGRQFLPASPSSTWADAYDLRKSRGTRWYWVRPQPRRHLLPCTLI
jgi:hypothetical protein